VLTGLELPLILAATEPLESIYRSLNSYPHLVLAGCGSSGDTAKSTSSGVLVGLVVLAAAEDVLFAVSPDDPQPASTRCG